LGKNSQTLNVGLELGLLRNRIFFISPQLLQHYLPLNLLLNGGYFFGFLDLKLPYKIIGEVKKEGFEML